VSSSNPMHLRVFVASPGDVASERVIARGVLDQLPYDPLLRGRVTIEEVAWDRPGGGAPMLATLTPQDAIKAGLPKPSQCDIVVVILWARMGTPLPAEYRKADGSPYLSGTEWEYEDALAAAGATGRPDILVYRRTERCLLDPDAPDFEDKLRQWNNVRAFFEGFRNPDGSIRRGSNEYATPEDLRELFGNHMRTIIHRRLEAPAAPRPEIAARPTPDSPPLWEGSPFPGLRAFTPDDAPIFFGRGRETDELVRRVADAGNRFLVVVGASGSGKSSLVAAGLLPRLTANAVEGAKDWLLPGTVPGGAKGRRQWAGLRFTPGEFGDNPFQSVAACLPDDGRAPREVAAQLESSPTALVDLTTAALANAAAWSEVLLFVDQFEELFTVAAERYRAPFVAMLAAAAAAPRLRVVATLRADFYHRCVASETLAGLLRTGSFPLSAPGAGALVEMITGPAARAGLTIDTELVGRIVDHTTTNPGALALLAFTLHELYERRTDGTLSAEAYEAIGRVDGAIGRRAETIYQQLPPESQALLGAVFSRLIEVDAQGVATRRRAPRETLATSPAADTLLNNFIDARLLVADRGPGEEVVVDLAHEALLREWPNLAKWIAERADDLRALRQAEAAAAEWARCGRDAAHLWPHERLAPVYEALDRLDLARESLAEPARTFLQPEAERLLAELERPETSHYRRAEIGDRLDRFDDPRPGVGLRPDGVPDIVWCDIPPGTVTLEGRTDRFEVEGFSIAKYAVTYRQYRAFLDDPDGYRSKRWWKGLKRETKPGEQYRPTGNCPTENVSWYDAVAYGRWLSERLGYDVTLPTEGQWQQAATGGDPKNLYPWGPDWAEGCANTSESRLSRTTAVGMYPAGASIHGVLDLAGNVEEWCLNKYERPTDTEERGNDLRVVRGGAWFFDRGLARCADRYGFRPGYRYYDFGFRLERVSPIP